MTVLLAFVLWLQQPAHPVAEIAGTWQGTSTCTDRVAAPACNDEVIVYEITPGAAKDKAQWKAYKVVDGRRDLMGEMELSYSAADTCWRGEFGSPRTTVVWCLVASGNALTGTAMLLPGKQIVRSVRARRP